MSFKCICCGTVSSKEGLDKWFDGNLGKTNFFKKCMARTSEAHVTVCDVCEPILESKILDKRGDIKASFYEDYKELTKLREYVSSLYMHKRMVVEEMNTVDCECCNDEALKESICSIQEIKMRSKSIDDLLESPEFIEDASRLALEIGIEVLNGLSGKDMSVSAIYSKYRITKSQIEEYCSQLKINLVVEGKGRKVKFQDLLSILKQDAIVRTKASIWYFDNYKY